MIQYLLAAATLLFVASLPIAATAAGKALRRWALLCFILALAPAVVFGLLSPTAAGPTSSAVDGRPGGLSDGVGAAVGLAILSPLAYGILALRRRFRPKSRDPWADYLDRRAVGKKPVDPNNPHAGGTGPTGLFGGSP